MKIYFICTLFFSFTLLSACDLGDVSVECEKIAIQISRDHSLETMESKIEKWKTYEKKCSCTSEYKTWLSAFYADANKLTESRALAEEVIASNGDTRMAEQVLALLEAKENNIMEEEKRINTIIKKYPKWYNGYMLRGFFSIKVTEDFQGAIKDFEQANTIKESAEAYSGLSIVYHKLKNYKKSFDCYEKALSINSYILAVNRTATTAGINSAMILGYWGGAESMLNALKKEDPTITEDSRYHNLISLLEMQKTKQNQTLKNDILNVIKNQIAAIQANDIDKAYTYTSVDFKNVTPFKEFKELIEAYPELKKNESITLTEENIGLREASVRAILKDKDRLMRKIDYTFIKDRDTGEWKMIIMHIVEEENDSA